MRESVKKVLVYLIIVSMVLLGVPTAGFAEENKTMEADEAVIKLEDKTEEANRSEEQNQAESKQLYVNGIDALKENQGIGWSYDDATQTLTLENAKISHSAINQSGVIHGSFADERPLKLVLKGENIVSVPEKGSCIYVSGNLEITGAGSLTATNEKKESQNSMINVYKGSKEHLNTGHFKYTGTGAITLLTGAENYMEAEKDCVGINCYGDYTQTGGTVTVGNESNWLGAGLIVGAVSRDDPSNMMMSGGTLNIVSCSTGIGVNNGSMQLKDGAQVDVLRHSKEDMGGERNIKEWPNLRNDKNGMKETYGVGVFSDQNTSIENGRLDLSGGSKLSVKMEEESKDFLQSRGIHAISMSVTEGSKINADVKGVFAYGISTSGVKSSGVDAELDLYVKDSEITSNISTLHVGEGISSTYLRCDNSKINTEIKGEAYQEDYFYAVAALVCNSNPFNPNMTFKNNLEVFNGSEINAKAGFYSDMDQVPNDEKNNDGFVKGIWSFGGILANNSSILAEANLNAQKKMEIPVMIDGIRSVRIDEDSATGHIKAEESSIQGKAVSNLPKLQDNQNMGGIWADQFIELNDSDMAGTGSNWGIASKENLIVNGLRNDQSVMGKAYQDGVGIVSVTGDIDLTKNHITLPATGVIGKTDNVRFSDANAVLEVKGSQKAAAEAIIQSGIPVKILENPSDITLKPKGKATFSVKTEGTSPITYKWEVSADGGKNWTMIDGATGESYAIEAVTAEMNGYQYRCTVSNSWGSTTSEAALLTVIAPPLPTPSNEGETNIKTGLTDKQSSAAYAIVLLSIAGLAAIGFRRKFTK